MKAYCLTDLLNHTFPLDHCFKGTIFASSTHVLWELFTSELLALATSHFFFLSTALHVHVKFFELASLCRIWLNLLDLQVDVLHIEDLNLIPKSFCLLGFPTWKVFSISFSDASIFILENYDDFRGDLRGSKLLWTLVFCYRVGMLFSFKLNLKKKKTNNWQLSRSWVIISFSFGIFREGICRGVQYS